MTNHINKAFLLIVFLFLFVSGFAQKVDPADINRVKKNFQNEHQITGKEVRIIPLISNMDTLAFVYDFQHAFVVISNYKSLPPVKAYSTENGFSNEVLNPESGLRFSDILIDDFSNSMIKSTPKDIFTTQNKKDWQQIYSPVTKGTKVQYGPWLDNIYGQTNCKDENNYTINVTNLYTPQNYAVGCVAITFVELLQYFEWPRIGVGSHSYNDNQGSSTGLHSVRFDKKYYNWGLIKDTYYKVPTTTAERQELGNLAYHCAVSINMDFEYNGATSNINRIPSAANKYFRYTAQHVKKSVSSFWAQVDTNIINGFPVQFAIYTNSGAGHAIVCDGIKPEIPSKQYYHLNMGWWGSTNAWYLIQNGFNAGGYTNITAAVVDMFPIPELNNLKINIPDETVELAWFFTQRMPAESYELQVKVGADNWKTIDNAITAQTYSYKYENTKIHRFRVRAKLGGKWNTLGYSNNMTIDIEKEVSSSKSEEVLVYPTLVIDNITVEYYDLEHSSIEIFNTMGTKVFGEGPGVNTTNKRIINLQTLPSGIYILRVKGDNVEQSVKFFKN